MRHMRSPAPPLLPIFRTSLQPRILLQVLTSNEGITAMDLARRLNEPQPTVARETRRLLDAGLLRGERIGQAIRLHPATENPVIAPLRQLLIIAFGPRQLLEQTLSDIEGIDEAYVYGSWAARYHGEPGPPPHDIDLLIVGRPDRDDIDAALHEPERELGREINVTYVSPPKWAEASEPFLRTVKERPLVRLELSNDRSVNS